MGPFELSSGPLGAYWEGLGRLAGLALLNFIIAVSALAWSFRVHGKGVSGGIRVSSERPTRDEGWRITEGLYYLRGLKVVLDTYWCARSAAYLPKEDGTKRAECTFRTAVECLDTSAFESLL